MITKSKTDAILIGFDEFLKKERDTFRQSQKFAQKRNMTNYLNYCEGVADAYQMTRVWLHVNLLPDRVEPGDILTAKAALGIKKCFS